VLSRAVECVDWYGHASKTQAEDSTMATENATSLVQDLLANNVRVSKQLIGAYRSATGYVVTRMDGGVKKVLGSTPATRVNVTVLNNVGAAAERLTGFYSKAFERVSDSADKIVDEIGDRTSGAIEKVATTVTNMDNKYASRYVEIVGRVSLPALKLARDLSVKLADGTDSLAIPAAKRVVKKAKRTVRKAGRRTRAA
jgi:hypothetical protein